MTIVHIVMLAIAAIALITGAFAVIAKKRAENCLRKNLTKFRGTLNALRQAALKAETAADGMALKNRINCFKSEVVANGLTLTEIGTSEEELKKLLHRAGWQSQKEPRAKHRFVRSHEPIILGDEPPVIEARISEIIDDAAEEARRPRPVPDAFESRPEQQDLFHDREYAKLSRKIRNRKPVN